MTSQESLRQHLEDIAQKCLHCGLCLPTCPTYSITQNEQSSPRGRIHLIHAVHRGELNLTRNFVDEMYFCLDCQACETACPAGVRYGELVEEARNQIREEKSDTLGFRILKSIFLKNIILSKSRIKYAARLMRLYEKSGLRDAVEQSEVLKLFSPSLHEKHMLIPRIDGKFFDDMYPEKVNSPDQVRGRVAFLTGCIMNVSFSDIHSDALEVLLYNGFEVVIPRSQVCCGSLHAHNGELEDAKNLARKNIDVFEKYEYDALVVDSAGCSAFMKEYGKVLQDDSSYCERAQAFSKKVKEITEFLAEAGFKTPLKRLSAKVTYHEACHLVHTQKISEQPRKVISAIPGIEFVEMNESTWCCGSAGIYNIVRYEDSMKILDRKLENIQGTTADIVVTSNPGCHLQILYGIKKHGLKMEVLHPVSLLARAYRS